MKLVCIMALACSAAFAQTGDAARGKAVFEGKGQCFTCHRINGNGSRTGPDLTDIGNLRKQEQLEKSILDPDAEIDRQNRTYRVVTSTGETISGRLLNMDAFSIQLLDSKERLRSFTKSNLKEWAFVEKSPMPSFKDKLNAQELADVVSYLVSLKGIEERIAP
ncbi:MAG: c-type cytochrome [Bryobacteraceae bacterium]